MQKAASAALAAYIRLIDRTGRFELKAHPETIELIGSRRPFIGAFWHGRMMLMQPAWRRLIASKGNGEALRPCVIASNHADAVLVAQVMSRLGLDVLHGSNKRGGLAVYRNALRVLESRRIAVITPDGPRGPAEEAKSGIVRLAQQGRVPIVPLTFAARPARRLRSWDSFIVPAPFAHGVIVFGPPLFVASGDDLEEARLEVTSALNRVSEAADASLTGVAAAKPA